MKGIGVSGRFRGKHPVNQKTCYIWFVSGEELIELCHEDGTSLEAETNNRYKVECNEKIYYG